MFRKKSRTNGALGLAVLALCLFAFAARPAAAQQPVPQQGARLFAVLPFKVNSDKYRYMSPGAQSMLASRLAWTGYFEPVSQAAVARAGSAIPATLSEAEAVMARIGAEYLVTGDLEFRGDRASAAVKVWSRTGQTWSKSAKDVPLEGLVPALNGLAGDVRTEVFKRPGETPVAAEREGREQATSPLASVSVPRNAGILVGDSDEPPVGPSGGPVLNPQFRYEGGAETPGRWRSQSLRFAATNMAIGDYVGDRKNRLILADSNTLYAYEYFRNTLRPLGQYKMSNRTRVLRVSLIDIDHDGTDEIVVSAVDDPEGNSIPRGYVLKYADGAFKPMFKPVDYYLAAMRVPPSYNLTLIGQRKGFHGPFEPGVSEMIYQNGTLEPIQKLHVPRSANVFNFAFLPDKETMYKIVLLNDSNDIRVFTSNLEQQFSQDEGYNSSGVHLLDTDRVPGMDMIQHTDGTETFYYIPIRMIPAKFDPRGKYELLMNKDISVASQIFEKFRHFSQGEVHSMFWDGVGMNLAWKTRRIKGTVVDIGLADLKNNGSKQLVVCLNSYSGALNTSDEKTIVMAYDLNSPKK